jgi:hypothetical protein
VRTLALVLALGSASLVAGCRKDCVAVCEANQKVIKCKSTDCKASCGKLHDAPTCKPEMASFESCFVKTPPDKWECDEDGQPALKDGVCSPERAAVMKCLENEAIKAAKAPAGQPPAAK